MFPSSSGVEEIHEGRRGVIELNGGVGMKREVQKKKWDWASDILSDMIFTGSIYSSREEE